jgi:neutral amino acid transport system ATP-binding protein
MLLSAKGLSKSFGGIRAVNNAYLDVPQGRITRVNFGQMGLAKPHFLTFYLILFAQIKGKFFLMVS